MNSQIIQLAQQTLKALNTYGDVIEFENMLARAGTHHLQTALDMVGLVLKDGQLPEHKQKEIQVLQEQILYTIQQNPSPYMTRLSLQDISDILGTLTVTVTSDVFTRLVRMKAEAFLKNSETISGFNMDIDENGVLYAHLHFKGHNVNALPAPKDGEGFFDVFLKDDSAFKFVVYRIDITFDAEANLYFNGHLANEYVFMQLKQDFQIAI